MKLTRSQKEEEYLDTQYKYFISQEYENEFFCEECNKYYKGKDLWFRRGYGSSELKSYVTIDYVCPEKHVIKSKKSELFSNTFFDHLISFLVIAAILIFIILVLNYCPSDLPPIRYK